jgi:hypothetical protein
VPGTLFLVNQLRPSQAFSTALKVVETQIYDHADLPDDIRIYELENIVLGKYTPHEYAAYTVRVNTYSAKNSLSYHCEGNVSIRRVPFAKQPPGVIVLESVTNKYEIIAKLAPCRMAWHLTPRVA